MPTPLRRRPPCRRSGRKPWALSDGDEGRGVLVDALELQELVVAAARAVGIAAAYGRTRLVDRAAPRLAVEERADRAEVLVLLVAQQAHLFLRIVFRQARFRRGTGQPVMPRQALDVARRHLDLGIAAAIARALAARVLRPHRHGKRFSVLHFAISKSRALYARRMTFLA